RPLLPVEVTGDPNDERAVDRLAALLRESPVVLVGVWWGDGPPPGAGLGLDILLCGGARAARPWVACAGGVEAELDHLAAAAERSPGAAVSLAQLLRVGEPL